jgi:DNA-binding MurR/RpiR family transcriptional regulator
MKSEILNLESLIEVMAEVAAESNTYEKIAVYIERNYLQIVFMTAEEIAMKAGISQGSVSNFCKALGYRGYNDFVRVLQKIVSDKITAPQRLQFTNDSEIRQIQDIISIEMQNMQDLSTIMKGEEYEMLLEAIVSSDELVLMSSRMSATLLPYMKYILDKMRDYVTIAIPGSNEWNMLHLKNPEKTTIIAIGFPRYASNLLDKMKELKNHNLKIYSITDSRLSPLVGFSDNVIYVPTTTSSIFDMYSTPMAFINLLLRDAVKKIPSLDERLKALEKYEDNQGVYYGTKRN